MATRAIVTVLAVLRAAAPAHLPELPLGWGGWGAGGARGDEQVVYLPALLPREAQEAADRAGDVPLNYSFDAFGRSLYLPALLPRVAQLAADRYSFVAFGRSFELQLVPNRRLVARAFGVWSEGGRDGPLSAVDASCHFQNAGAGAVAALSACKDHVLHGLIVVDNSTYEVRPLTGAGRSEEDGRTAHVIRRAPPPPAPHDDTRSLRPRPRTRTPRARYHKPGPPSYTIEIALFLDEAGYKIFHPYFKYKETDLRDMLLAYINGVQALYQHWSLGAHIQLSLVRLTLLRSQPPSLPATAERGRLLDAFCAYQRTLNVEDDADPDHWDMALLLSGMDFYSEEGGRRNGVTMGLAPVGGVCLPAHACVVTEFGAQDALGRPYPSAGFTSVYIMAHEIGHNLGMHHDGTGNSCARDGFIMSPSRGTSGEATWSPCSARVVADLQWATCLQDDDAEEAPAPLRHERFGGAPGLRWDAKKQCEILLRDVDAVPSPALPQAAHCAQLACRTPHRAGFYYAGPALPGTPCGPSMWCQGGECVHSNGADTTTHSPASTTIPNTNHVAANSSAGDGWGAWRSGACRSGCTLRARGFRERRRACDRQPCAGAAYDAALCDDTKVCGKKKRVSAGELASRKCAEYAARVADLDPRGGGLQAPHDPTRMWMGCAVFCRRAAGGGFYAPRVELNDAGLDPYFPDGTWCHHDGTQDYYCLQHHCLPENFKMTAQWHIWDLPSEDISGPFNARARSEPEDPALRGYLSLSEDGVPLARSALPPRLPEEPEAHWEVDDYVDLPNNVVNVTQS